MAYTALYRVYRPQTFGDIVGQAHVTTTLRNALREGRLSHAYLFNGPRGTGKTSAAKIMSKAVNCESPQDGEPCNECPSCKAITSGTVTDVLEIDAASNRGVEEIRDIRDKVKFAPSDVSYKVYIIDEVHMLTTEAFNALLKTLEEPPPHVLFILATTEPHKLPATIISRCQRFDFHRIALSEMVNRLRDICEKQNVQVETQALQLVAKMAEGGMRDALSLLDQALSFSGAHVTIQDILQITGSVSQTYYSTMAKQIAEKDIALVMQELEQVMAQGKDPEHFLQDFMYYYRDMLLFKTAPGLQEIVERTLVDDQFSTVAELYTLSSLYDIIESLNQSLAQLKWSTYPRILVELSLVKLCHQMQGIDSSPKQSSPTNAAVPQQELATLVNRIRALEERVAQAASRNQLAGPAQEEAAPQQARRPVVPAGSGSSRTPMNKVRDVIRTRDEARTQKIRSQWGQILTEVKKVRIQHYAWLVNGQPAGVNQDSVVVVFKSPIHCDKTMEPELKGIVEKALQDVSGAPLQLLSVMEDQWQSLLDQSGVDTEEKQEDPFVAEALKLVGEQLLDIKD